MEKSPADKLMEKMEFLKLDHDYLKFEDPKNKMRDVMENCKFI